jgi:hypothetical protein
MALDPTYIRSRVPGVFDAVPDFALTEAIAAASVQVNPSAFGDSTFEATFLLACHIACMNKPGRAEGVRRFQADRVMTDYGLGKLTTAFKEQFDDLKKRKVLHIGVANVIVSPVV